MARREEDSGVTTGPPQVFINCPFDRGFGPLLDAITYTCVCCGFLPITAAYTGSSGRPRLDRIVSGISQCEYSIHDLSRCRGEGDHNLARFNMPLELGIAMCLNFLPTHDHEWMALVPNGLSHEHYISDLGGYDLDSYDDDDDIDTLISSVTAWLQTRDAAVPVPLTPRQISDALPSFRAAIANEREQWPGVSVPWKRVVLLANDHVPRARPSPGGS